MALLPRKAGFVKAGDKRKLIDKHESQQSAIAARMQENIEKMIPRDKIERNRAPD